MWRLVRFARQAKESKAKSVQRGLLVDGWKLSRTGILVCTAILAMRSMILWTEMSHLRYGRFNSTIFANLLWDINPTFRVGVEFTYRKTMYQSPFLPDNSGPGVHTQFQWVFLCFGANEIAHCFASDSSPILFGGDWRMADFDPSLCQQHSSKLAVQVRGFANKFG